jgi:hypothetical protein
MNRPWNESRVNDFSPIPVIVHESPKRSNTVTIIAQSANLSRRKYIRKIARPLSASIVPRDSKEMFENY